MKKVLVLANSSAGIYNFRNEVMLALLEKYEVYISLPDDLCNAELEQEGCKIIVTPINRRGVNPIEDVKLCIAYIRLLREVKPDIVLTYTIKPNIYGGIACRWTKTPYICNITGLGSALENTGILQRITLLLYRVALKSVSVVFLQNVSNKKFFEEKRVTGSRLRLIPGSGVNVEKYAHIPWPQQSDVFVYMSRVMREKGIEEYLDCAKRIKSEHPNAVFNIVGYCEEEYEETLKQLSDDGVVAYHGSVKDVIPYLEKAGCLINPSFYPEGMSNVCLEAAASGRVVITTNRPGCQETVIDGVTGYLVPTRDMESLYHRVEEYLQLPEEQRREMGIQGRKYILENFDRKIVIKAYLDEIKVQFEKRN